MVRGKIRPLIKPFPKGRQNTWKQQKLFMHLSDKWEEIRESQEPFSVGDQALYGDYKSLYGIARYSSQS
jgi:hypothetical protein|tara:strand:- start:694 stop:900 length:207 start_codon:yes stop_codon:yes gene_type:complete